MPFPSNSCGRTLPALLILLGGLLLSAVWSSPEVSASMQESDAEDLGNRRELIWVFVTGGYLDMVSYRLRELAFTIFTTTIFYGYGLGLGGDVGRLGTIGIALLIFPGRSYSAWSG
jgi:hypothetical protein